MAVEIGIKVEEHFANPEQQREAARLGMWIFLGTELLMFSGMFVSALIIRVLHPASVTAAALHFKYWIGATNAAILIVSGLTMSIAIELSRVGEQRWMVRFMVLTAAIAAVYVFLTGYEYWQDFQDKMMPFLPNRPYALVGDPASRLFTDLYFLATGLHLLHIIISIGLILVMSILARREQYMKQYFYRTEILGIFWHFMILLWLLIFTTFYLLNR